MDESKGKSNFWTTLPGIFTGLAALITAVGGIYLGMHNNSAESKITSTAENAENAHKESLRVPAGDTKGTLLTNKTGSYAAVDFEATGLWLAIPESISDVPEDTKGFISPDGGDPNFESSETPCARYPIGALVIRGEDSQCKATGSAGTFELSPGESVYFLMNDVPTLYGDNEGYIDVTLSMSKSQ